MLTEQFKPIKDYEGYYEISNFGNVKSLARSWKARFGIRSKLDIILSPSINNHGYFIVGLCVNGIRKTKYIHHLVWDTFNIKQRNGRKLQVDHIDNNKKNNRIDNLQLLTSRGNTSKGKLFYKKNGLPIGVYWNQGKYRSEIVINGKRTYLGYFDNVKLALNAYKEALLKVI